MKATIHATKRFIQITGDKEGLEALEHFVTERIYTYEGGAGEPIVRGELTASSNTVRMSGDEEALAVLGHKIVRTIRQRLRGKP